MADTHYDYCIGTANTRLKKSLKVMLAEAGFYSSGEADSVPLFLRKLRMVQPWLAVVDTALPPGNIEQLAAIIESDGLAAAIYINPSGIRLDNHVQLSWPVESPVFIAVAKAICNEFVHKKKLQREIENLQRKLHDRKVIEKAKGVLANHYSLSEEDAYRFLQKSSMEKRINMAEMAGKVINEPDRFAFLKQRL